MTLTTPMIAVRATASRTQRGTVRRGVGADVERAPSRRVRARAVAAAQSAAATVLTPGWTPCRRAGPAPVAVVRDGRGRDRGVAQQAARRVMGLAIAAYAGGLRSGWRSTATLEAVGRPRPIARPLADDPGMRRDRRGRLLDDQSSSRTTRAHRAMARARSAACRTIRPGRPPAPSATRARAPMEGHGRRGRRLPTDARDDRGRCAALEHAQSEARLAAAQVADHAEVILELSAAGQRR